MARALIIDPPQLAVLAALRKLATKHLVDARVVSEMDRDSAAWAAYREQCRRQTVLIPIGFVVSLTLETNQPTGDCRHLSVAVEDQSEMPSPLAVWTIATELGFWGDPHDATFFVDTDPRAAWVVNVLQPIILAPAGHA